MKEIAALCVQEKTIYRRYPQVDCWDKNRDAYLFNDQIPVICHPPCGQWGRFKGVALKDEKEKGLGPHCVDWVRKNGGVLEHPSGSKLFHEMNMPMPGEFDSHGFTVSVNQSWFGNRGDKSTWLYVCGVPFYKLPSIPSPVFLGHKLITKMSSLERSRTPLNLSDWLVSIAGAAGDHRAREARNRR